MDDPTPQAAGDESVDEPCPDRAAEFMQLYSSHYQRVQFFLMSLMPTADDASDVLQETSVVLWKKFDTFEPGTDFFAWACKIARYQSLKHRERQRRANRVLDDDVVNLIARDAARSPAPVTGAQDALAECLDSLPDDDRTMIIQRYQPGASVNEMADGRGWTANRLSKALAKVRQSLLTCIQRKLAIESR